MAKDLCDLAREPALRGLLGALHEQHDVITGDLLADQIVGFLLAHGVPFSVTRCYGLIGF
jgi:hypothetical protein